VKDENDLADSCNTLNRWKNYFSQLLNVHSISVVRQIHTAELQNCKSVTFQLVIKFRHN
jgi:hypothetical protein